jgi:radical SAM superfamily enzyme YgiQ (UPF0313 family)
MPGACGLRHHREKIFPNLFSAACVVDYPMHVAVALPPIRDLYLSPRRVSALGCRTLVNLLEKAGHTAGLFLFPLRGKGHPLPLPTEAAYLEDWIIPDERGPLSFFTGMKHFGPGWRDCAEIIAAENPGAVFISSFAYAYAEDAVLLAAALREVLPDTPVIAGGAGPSAWPEYYLSPPLTEGPVFDAVFTGEAEAGFPLLLYFLESGAPSRRQTLLLKASHSAAAESLDCVFSLQRETRNEAWVSVSLSRGCPLGCRFCSNRLCHGSEFRTVSPEKIETAAAGLPKGKRLHINFEDDNLLLDPPWFRGALKFFRQTFPGTAFAAENGLDYRLLPPEAAEELIALGFEKFNLSLASVEEAAPETQARKTDPAAYLAAAGKIAEHGVPLVGYFIAGLEGDSPENLARHLAFLAKAPGLAGISLFYPVPGISGFDPPPDILRRHPGLARGSLAYPWTGSLRTGQLVTAFRLARLVNLIKKTVPSPQEEELLGRCFAEKRLFTLRRDEEGKSGAENHGKFRVVPAPADKGVEKLFFEIMPQYRHAFSGNKGAPCV